MVRFDSVNIHINKKIMGGKLFKTKYGTETIRLQKEDYFNLYETIKVKLFNLFKQVELIDAYHTKLDYGDIDVLVSSPRDTYTKLFDQIKNEFNLLDNQISQNSNIYSILINNFQCDFILTKEKYLQSSLNYYYYSPAGNLCGKLTHRWGLHYGFDGLSYILRDNENTYKLGKIEITQNHEKICEFLGLDYQKYFEGFETEKEIFDWIINAKCFDARIFSYENMNHIARIRDRKRPDYARFMKYIERFKDKIYDWPLKSENIKYINDFFPESNLINKIQELKNKETKRKEGVAKWNGDLVRDWCPGLEGKELGKVLSEFKFHRGACSDARTFEDYLQMYPAEKIKSDFFAWVKESKVYSMSEINS